MKNANKIIFVAILGSILSACAARGPEMKKGAHNAVESYALNDDGSIQTTFTFLKDGFDGEKKQYNPKGFVTDTQTNATWGMRFIWPIKADYRIIYVAEDYSQTVIARQKRDFIWIMARTATIPEADYERMIKLAETVGYDVSKIERVPQRW